MELVNVALEEDRRVRIRELSDRIQELSDRVGVERTIIDVFLKDRLKMNKVCAKLIPRILTEETKITRVTASKKFLSQ